MRKFLREAWLVLVERMQIHRAERILVKQEWSVELLTKLMRRAARMENKDALVRLTNKQTGQVMEICAKAPTESQLPNKDKELDLRDENLTLDALLTAAWNNGVFKR